MSAELALYKKRQAILNRPAFYIVNFTLKFYKILYPKPTVNKFNLVPG